MTYATSKSGTEALGKPSNSSSSASTTWGQCVGSKTLIFQGLSALAAKPHLSWESELEGAGKNEPVKISFLWLDSSHTSQGEHGHEMKGRGREALTTMREMTLLGLFRVGCAQGASALLSCCPQPSVSGSYYPVHVPAQSSRFSQKSRVGGGGGAEILLGCSWCQLLAWESRGPQGEESSASSAQTLPQRGGQWADTKSQAPTLFAWAAPSLTLGTLLPHLGKTG